MFSRNMRMFSVDDHRNKRKQRYHQVPLNKLRQEHDLIRPSEKKEQYGFNGFEECIYHRRIRTISSCKFEFNIFRTRWKTNC